MFAPPTPTPTLSPGPPPPIRSSPKSSDYVNVFLGRYTRCPRTLPSQLNCIPSVAKISLSLSRGSTNAATNPGSNRMSLFTKSNRSPPADMAPRFRAGARPRFFSRGSHRTPRLFATSADSSDEQLSTTMTSSDLNDCEARLGKQRRRCSAPFQLTITTDTFGFPFMNLHFGRLKFYPIE